MTGINLRLIPGEEEFMCVFVCVCASVCTRACERVRVIVVCDFCVTVVYNRSQRDWRERGLRESVCVCVCACVCMCVCVLVCLCLFVARWSVVEPAHTHVRLVCAGVCVCASTHARLGSRHARGVQSRTPQYGRVWRGNESPSSLPSPGFSSG